MPDFLAPFDEEMEQAVLGSLLISPDLVPDVITHIGIDDFFVLRNQWIYSAVIDLYNERQPIDLLTVSDRLRAHPDLEPGYLSYLLTVPKNSKNAPAYAIAITRLKHRRDLLTLSSHLATAANSTELDIKAIRELALDGFNTWFTSFSEGKQVISQREAVNEYIENIERIVDEIAVDFIKTGLHNLDHLITGIGAGQLITLASQRKMNKSGLALNIAINAAKQGKHVLIVSREMQVAEIIPRIVARKAKLSTYQQRVNLTKPLRRPDGSQELDKRSRPVTALSKIFSITGDIGDLPISYTYTQSVMELKALCKSLWLDGKLDLLIVDYGQLMTAPGDSKEQRVSNVWDELKTLVHSELRESPTSPPTVGCLCVSQLNADGETYYSSYINMVSDVVIKILLPSGVEKHEAGIRLLQIAEQRNGPCGDDVIAQVYCNPKYFIWDNLSEKEDIRL